MMRIAYSRRFLRDFARLHKDLQKEVVEKVELFKDPRNHRSLRVHKLKGKLEGRFGFSVNYKFRILFQYVSKRTREVVLLTVGDHDVYKS